MKDARITLAEVTSSLYLVYISGKYIGAFVRDVDGYYYYDPSSEHGLWGDYTLRLIADKLTELNAPWSKHLDEYFASEKEKANELL